MASVLLRCSLGDLVVSSGLLRLPPRGNWSAALELGWDEAPELGEPASLVFVREDDTEDVFAGIVRRSSLDEGAGEISVSIAGGAGQLLADVQPLDQVAGDQQIPAGLVARAICDDAGELLADGVEDALDAFQLGHWTRLSMPAGKALDLLVDVLGLSWRVQADGSIWVGAETWEAVDGAAHYIGQADDDLVIYAPDGAPLLPGTTIDGTQAVAVEYQISPGKLRAQVRSAVAGDPPRVPDLTLYRASYAGSVKSQAASGKLDITADDPRVGDLLGVDFRCGIPGAKVTIPSGSRVRVAFEGADPRGVYAFALDQDSGAEKAIALKDDDVEIGYLLVTCAAPGSPAVLALSPGFVPNSIHLVGRISGPCSVQVKIK